MPTWLSDVFAKSGYFMPHGHCYLWIPSLLWLHVISDFLIGVAYLGISFVLYALVRKIRLPFSPVFIAFGLFIGLCGLTHFMSIWTVWNPDYFADGLLKAATAAASVATAIGLVYVRPQIEAVVHAARLSEERRVRLESTNAELETLYHRIKDLDQLKTEFFANISHELRTPLALILGPAESMQRDKNLSIDQRHQLDLIARNGKLLLKQVNDLLDVAKLEAGGMQLNYVRLNLAAWCRRIASQFAPAAASRRMSFEIDAPEALTAEVDPHLLEPVLINLLANALKFTPEGGRVRFELSRERDEVVLAVKDTGPGISADQHERIFERFRQVEGGATRSYGGTGLGLAIVKDYVALHGGRVAVDSTPGQGARFTVRLPAQAPEGAAVTEEYTRTDPVTRVALEAAIQELTPAESKAGTPTIVDAAHATVLVVEDNDDMRSFIAHTLAGDFNVLVARNGREALEQAAALTPDVIVTDLMMPVMSGDQLVAELRRQDAFAHVPVLLLTAKADEDLRVELLRSGAQDYLTKPFLPQELLARVSNLASAKRAGDALRESVESASADLEELAKELSLRHRQLQTAIAASEVAREQAERASEIKTYFLGLISHELRTPLFTIQTNAQLLERSHDLHPPLRTRVERIARAGKQLSTLVEGLLEYTRLEGDRIKVDAREVDVAALAQEVIADSAHLSRPEVHLQLEATASRKVMSDPRLLRVVLANLVSNALKFTREGSVSVRIEATDASCVIEVQDTGPGIPEADLPRIFLPFEQLEPVARKSIPGFGLGLALVKRVVESIEGTIDVASSPGEGSTFTVRIPVGTPELLTS